jgi:oxidoreductase
MFICLGTTRAQAGSAANFVKIDHDYPLHASEIFKATNASPKHVLLVTAGGSNKNSWFLYPKTKGLLEENIRNLGFESYSIFHPALLIPDTEDREIKRTLEGAAIWMSGKMGHPKSISVNVRDVAKAMRVVAETKPSQELFDNAEIHQLAASGQ